MQIGKACSPHTTYFYYEGWNLIQEGTSFANPTKNYVHGARVDEIVKQIRPTDWWERYFHYDARGHCTLQTDTAGNIVEQYEYDAFGYPYFYNGGGTNVGYSEWGNRFLFTGREWLSDQWVSGQWLSDLKLYDYRNRMYQPELGRFMQPDPKEFGGGDYNLYRYCHNDPVNKADPFGLWPPGTHEQIIDKALKDKLTEKEREILKNESKAVDRDQSTAGSYKHGMRAPDQSVENARQAHEKYIADNLKNAIQQQKAGNREEALRALGRGIHALSDSTSPTHEGYQVWYGLPNPLTQSLATSTIIAAAAATHLAGESGAISDAKLNQSASLVSDYYAAFVSGSSR